MYKAIAERILGSQATSEGSQNYGLCDNKALLSRGVIVPTPTKPGVQSV